MLHKLMSLNALFTEIRACTHCASELPLGPRPVVRGSTAAKILIIGQAPGTRVHETGVPWNDKSGERLRQWMRLSPAQFYDENMIAIMPMGFCYPGKSGSADAPPRPECAPLWHAKLLAQLPNISLTLLVGQFAQAHYLSSGRKKTMTETVKNYATYLEDGYFPLPHPSWRVQGWEKKNPWFALEVLPALKTRVTDLS